ncbi:hypothetical protein GY45DRAFT_1001443 [Cubamyces sp. BRFM 1775]|nr:hypothetical protein GY45DRAFT_1001443 [Cubamyces sp. BRFM 1775]
MLYLFRLVVIYAGFLLHEHSLAQSFHLRPWRFSSSCVGAWCFPIPAACSMNTTYAKVTRTHSKRKHEPIARLHLPRSSSDLP